jgi:uncharacterized protein YbbK (DUF523 family)
VTPKRDHDEVVLVSACLLGHACRYDGRDNASSAVAALIAGRAVVPICPEAGAGLGTPRPPVQLCGGDGESVLDGRARAREVESGEDRTEAFLEGARLAVEAAVRHGATLAVLKERSPSCGTSQCWQDGQKRPGAGVAAAALRRAGILVMSDERRLDASHQTETHCQVAPQQSRHQGPT